MSKGTRGQVIMTWGTVDFGPKAQSQLKNYTIVLRLSIALCTRGGGLGGSPPQRVLSRAAVTAEQREAVTKARVISSSIYNIWEGGVEWEPLAKNL